VLHPAFRSHPRLMWIGLLAACVPIIHLLAGSLTRDPTIAVLIIPLVAVVLVALRWPRIGSLMFVAIGLLLIMLASFSVTVAHGPAVAGYPDDQSWFWIGAVLFVAENSLTLLGGVLLFLGARRHREQTASAALSHRHRTRREAGPVVWRPY
jgi:hypothetical protein